MVVREVSNCALRDARRRSRVSGRNLFSIAVTDGKFLLLNRSTAKQIAIAVVCHPLCTRQVTIKYTASARRFAIRVDMQHDPSNFLPLGAVGLGIKKTPIRYQMLFIVGRKHRIIRSCVSDMRIEGWFLHHTHIRTLRRLRHRSVAIQTSVPGLLDLPYLVR